MTDLSKVTLQDFEPYVGQTFPVTPEHTDGFELELTQVKPLGAPGPAAGARQPFSLLFRGPLEPVLAQQISRIEHPTLGELALFLVPIGPDENGMLYDVSFN